MQSAPADDHLLHPVSLLEELSQLLGTVEAVVQQQVELYHGVLLREADTVARGMLQATSIVDEVGRLVLAVAADGESQFAGEYRFLRGAHKPNYGCWLARQGQFSTVRLSSDDCVRLDLYQAVLGDASASKSLPSNCDDLIAAVKHV